MRFLCMTSEWNSSPGPCEEADTQTSVRIEFPAMIFVCVSCPPSNQTSPSPRHSSIRTKGMMVVHVVNFAFSSHYRYSLLSLSHAHTRTWLLLSCVTLARRFNRCLLCVRRAHQFRFRFMIITRRCIHCSSMNDPKEKMNKTKKKIKIIKAENRLHEWVLSALFMGFFSSFFVHYINAGVAGGCRWTRKWKLRVLLLYHCYFFSPGNKTTEQQCTDDEAWRICFSIRFLTMSRHVWKIIP